MIFLSPPWFFYEALIMDSGREPVRVRVHQDTFDLDLHAIAAAITSRTARGESLMASTPLYPSALGREWAQPLS